MRSTSPVRHDDGHVMLPAANLHDLKLARGKLQRARTQSIFERVDEDCVDIALETIFPMILEHQMFDDMLPGLRDDFLSRLAERAITYIIDGQSLER